MSQPAGSTPDLFTTSSAPRHQGVQAAAHYLTMTDDTQIAIDVLRPTNPEPERPVPVVMIMARYWRSLELRIPQPPNRAPIGPREAIGDYLIARGFAVVVVDARGTGASTGVSRHPWTAEELADYGAVAAWAAAQSWCSGTVGAVGLSYEGTTAHCLLAAGLTAVKGVVAMGYELDLYADIALPGGLFNAEFIRQWSESNRRLDSNRTGSLFPWLARLMVKGVRPVDADRRTRAVLTRALREHQANTDVYQATAGITYRDDPFGATGATLDDFSLFRYRAALAAAAGTAMVWGSWLDGATADNVIRLFNTLDTVRLGIIGAWKHEMTAHGSPFRPPRSRPHPPQAQQWAAITWFLEQTLRHDQPPAARRLLYYTLGAEEWRQTAVFPLPTTRMQTWYFQAEQGLAPIPPTDGQATDSYTVDFAASTGRTNRWHTQMARPLVYGDRASADRRLLTYTSAPLADDLEITGYPVVTLYIASTADDGAFFVYLEAVDEQGIVRYITEGQLRGIHRALAVEPAPYWTGVPYRTFRRAAAQPLPPGQFVELTFGLLPTSVVLRRGQRLRVALAGADSETFAHVPATETPRWQVGRGQGMASAIQLPVIP